MKIFQPFTAFGDAVPQSPVIISVPHAGRAYFSAIAAQTRLTREQLVPLEDRFADMLAAPAFAAGFSGIIAHTPRCWIDLNRGEREYDPAMLRDRQPTHPIMSSKVRGGLGLIPRRIASGGDIWRQPITSDDFNRRLNVHYRPYHTALADMLKRTRDCFGIAVLIDLHSMPPITNADGAITPQIVVGDRFNRSSHDRFTGRVLAVARRNQISAAVNHPYAGGHILDHHADPDTNIHGVQIEIDRSLYLEADRLTPNFGLARMQRIVGEIALALADEASGQSLAIAAE